MQYIIGFVIGLIVGGLAVFLVYRLQRKQTEVSFAALSRDALSKNSEDARIRGRRSLCGRKLPRDVRAELRDRNEFSRMRIVSQEFRLSMT